MRLLYKILTAILAITLVEYEIIPQTDFSFVCKDPKISQPFTGDTISGKLLLTVTFLGPLIIIISIERIREISFESIDRNKVKTLYKKCVIGSVYVLLITEVLKSVVNEARPHFLDSCQPDTNNGCNPGDVIIEYQCTNTRLDGFHKNDLTRSFPSGHTSLSTFVGLFCAFLVLVRVPSDSKRSVILKVFLVMVCLGWNFLCAGSRLFDKRHHWWDVMAGAFIGSSSAFYILYSLPREEKPVKENEQLLNEKKSSVDS